MAETIPEARLVDIPDAGHLSTLEQPERVTAAMLEFIRGLPGRS
jgi:pimeloyl-ACP methyl ester carboxylesterase